MGEAVGAVKRSELKRKPMKPSKPMKRSQPRRNWQDAWYKILTQDGGCCRVCGTGADPIHAAHIVGREHDKPFSEHNKTLWVNPDSVVPLCVPHHRRYDPHTRGVNEEPLDLLPSLTEAEKRQALDDLEYDVFAYLFRLTGRRFVPKEEEAA